MDQPLGSAVGNALEIFECVRILQNKKFELSTALSCDLKELSLHLCAQMLLVGGLCKTMAEGKKRALQALADGSALEKFRAMVVAHGDIRQIDYLTRLPLASCRFEFAASESGYLTQMDCESIRPGKSPPWRRAFGCQRPDQSGVGMVFHRKLGSRVKVGDSIATVYTNDERSHHEITQKLRAAITIENPLRKAAPPLLMGSGR